MSGLAEFLLARIEDEAAAAQAALRESSYGWSDNAFTEAVELAENEGAVQVATSFIARWDPSRVLAECEARRRIVARKPRVSAHDNVKDLWWDTLALLAQPYASHPDFDPSWRV